MTVVTGEGTTAVRDRWSAGGWLAAVCVFLLLAAGIPGRAVAATPAGTAPGLGAVRLVEEGNHVTIELDLTGDLKADLLRDWVEQIDRSHPLLSDTIKENLQTYRLEPPITVSDDSDWVDFDGTLSVTDTGLAVDLVGPDVHTSASWWVRVIAAGVSLLAAVGLRLLCYGFFNVGAALAGPVCGALYGFFGVFIYQVIILFVDGHQGEWQAWAKALAYAIVAALGAAAWESGVNKFAKEQMRPLMLQFAEKLRSLAGQAERYVKILGGVIRQIATGTADMADFLPSAMAEAARTLFRIHPTDWPDQGLRVMIVGDSMTQGQEGDWTWRYRLSQWFKDSRIDVDFVGPYRGTKAPPPAAPPTPPPLPATPTVELGPSTSGGYPATFDSDHLSLWGWQAAQAKDQIRRQVATYQPDLLLVGLGFNDMGWFVSDAPGTLASIKTLIDEARAAKPGVDFAVANVPQRTNLGWRDDLILNTDRYNDLLKQTIPTWSTHTSRVELVDWRGTYSCETTGCPGGYDGLHPNARGEYEIAQAYENTLHEQYGLGDGVPPVPARVPSQPLPTPGNVRAASSPLGVTVTWDVTFGALGYDVRYRHPGETTWVDRSAAGNRYDTTWTVDGERWEYQVRAVKGDQDKSPWSPIVGATAHPQTAPPPVGIVATSTGSGINVVWGAPTGPYTDTIDRYGVLVFDQDTPNAFVQTIGVRGLSAQVSGLVPGHHYVVAVTTWNAAGGGLPGVTETITV